MDLTLSDAQMALQQKARAFCEEILQPYEEKVEEAGHLPPEARATLKEAVNAWGVNAINHAREVGGQGYGNFDQSLINEQMGRTTNGLWAAVWQPAICLADGTEA